MMIEPKKIMIVHNNPEKRGQLGIMLSRFGHEVRFSRGKGCPDDLSRASDLVIVDEELFQQSGLDFISQISSKQREKIIYLYSLSSLSDSIELQSLNIYECVTKPIDPLRLAVVVCDYFVESAMEHALPLQE